MVIKLHAKYIHEWGLSLFDVMDILLEFLNKLCRNVILLQFTLDDIKGK